ncbi:trafficking kinesin-binding protein 1 [Platysternon megacephalum]|uniref:Trafficking kinesin-binding protein 1 n=1 Tax=Platysternon megacephalum TaxID=55544 RepID=A0A4D9E496_9SAUR|nr:trafficking kinesin-binding protein 1 [Platysternon megacephalum]
MQARKHTVDSSASSGEAICCHWSDHCAAYQCPDRTVISLPTCRSPDSSVVQSGSLLLTSGGVKKLGKWGDGLGGEGLETPPETLLKYYLNGFSSVTSPLCERNMSAPFRAQNGPARRAIVQVLCSHSRRNRFLPLWHGRSIAAG